MKRLLLLLAMSLLAADATQARPLKVDRHIKKEPVYVTKTPQYVLLVFGQEGKEPVWLVRDGDTLHVDRNGDGDLTESGKKIVAEKRPGHDPAEEGFSFQAGDLHLAGQTHKGLVVSLVPLKAYIGGELGKRADVKAALKANPHAMTAVITIDVAIPGIHGGGLGGRVGYMVGPVDLNGVLQFADRPADAPVIHLGGPLEVNFYADLPTFYVGRSCDFCLVVGTPGVGPGTFAMVEYTDTIPAPARPVAEVLFPAARPDGPPVNETWVIKHRC